MTLKVNPPPLEVPAEFAKNKGVAAFFNGLINTIYQLWTATYGFRSGFKVKTTDASATAAIRVPCPAGRTVMVVAHCAAQQSNGNGAWYRLMGAYKNVAGTLTGIGTPSLLGGEDTAGWDFYFTNVGEEIVVTVLGAAASEITWEGTVSTYVAGA